MNVIIIGAGISGLAAASKLISNPKISKLTILEAKNRWGGRIFTKMFNVNGKVVPIDLGASWIHGMEGNPIPSLLALHPQGMPRLSSPEDLEERTRMSLNGKTISSETADKLGYTIWSLLEEMSDEAKEMTFESAQVSVYDWLNSGKLQQAWEDLQGINKEITLQDLLHLMQIVELYDASDLKTLGMETFRSDNSASGATPFVIDGMGRLVDVVVHQAGFQPDGTNRLNSNAQMLFNKVVTEIDWKEKCVYCLDGSSFTADKILCTLPFGVLKKMKFTPSLPENKLQALQSISYGTLDKIVLQFKELKWEPKVGFMYTFLDPIKAFGKEEWSRISELLSKDDLFPLPPDDSPILVSFMNLYPHHQVPILVAYTGNQRLIRAWNHLGSNAEDQVVDMLYDQIQNQLHFNLSRQDLVAHCWTNWSGDPFALGSYTSFPATMKQPSDVFVKSLAEPLNNTLFFAGEHTHPTYSSYAHGALDSGYIAADAIINS